MTREIPPSEIFRVDDRAQFSNNYAHVKGTLISILIILMQTRKSFITSRPLNKRLFSINKIAMYEADSDQIISANKVATR